MVRFFMSLYLDSCGIIIYSKQGNIYIICFTEKNRRNWFFLTFTTYIIVHEYTNICTIQLIAMFFILET